MTGLGGLNPTEGALVLGMVQQQVPILNEPADLMITAQKIAGMVKAARPACPHWICWSSPSTASTD